MSTEPDRPRMLGYLREPSPHNNPAEAGQRVDELTTQLVAFAAAEGFALGTVYVERLHTFPAAFEALLIAARRHDVDAIATPSRAHLEPLGEETRTRRLLAEANVQVMFVVPP